MFERTARMLPSTMPSREGTYGVLDSTLAVLAGAWRWTAIAAGTLTVLAGFWLLWWASNRLQREALLPGMIRPRPRGTIRSLTEDAIVVEQVGSRRIRLEGTWGLAGPDGYMRVSGRGPVDDRAALYEVESRSGAMALGDEVEFDAIAFASPPDGFQRITYEASSGRFDALQSGGGSSTWMIGVHGQSGSPTEMLRATRVAQSEGLSVLLPTYRNDPGQPRTNDGFYHFGRSEWEEVDGALAYALDHGAQDIIITANSMGAAIAGWVLRHSQRASTVRAMFLDSPLLDLTSAVRWTARRTGVPPGVADVAMRIQAVRNRIEWGAFDVRADFVASSIPLTIVHGDRDGQVPPALSEQLAASDPGRIKLIQVAGAGHCQAWNHAPERYEAALRELIRAILSRNGNNALGQNPVASANPSLEG